MSAIISTEEDLNHMNKDSQKMSNFLAQKNIDYEDRHYNITFQVCCIQLNFKIVLYIYLRVIKFITLNTFSMDKEFRKSLLLS